MKPARNSIGGLIMVFIMGLIVTNVFAVDMAEQTIKITAKRFEYSPNEIRLKKGVPVVLELTALDRLHGFNCPELGIRADVFPGKSSSVRLTPQKAGTYEFHCDIFCGDGHEGMTGAIIVEE